MGIGWLLVATAPELHYQDGQVEITKLVVGPVDNNVFVVRCRETGDAVLVDAIHLAAADRLPRPVTFVTFDPAQIPVALSLGFDVVST